MRSTIGNYTLHCHGKTNVTGAGTAFVGMAFKLVDSTGAKTSEVFEIVKDNCSLSEYYLLPIFLSIFVLDTAGFRPAIQTFHHYIYHID